MIATARQRNVVRVQQPDWRSAAGQTAICLLTLDHEIPIILSQAQDFGPSTVSSRSLTKKHADVQQEVLKVSHNVTGPINNWPVLNHYSIFAAHCQYHSCYTSANYCFGKNCTALNQLFYSHYLVVCIRLLLLLVVYTMCSRRNCQTTQLENWFRILLPCLWTCDLSPLFLCCFMFFLNFCIAVSCLYNCMSGCHLT